MQSFGELFEIGKGFLNTEKYQKAIEFFSRAIEEDINSSEAHELRGVAWFKIFNIDEALKDTSKAIEIDKKNHQAWYNQGELLRFRKEYEKAKLSFQEANNLYPDSLSYLTGLIQTNGALKKYDEAIQYCNEILNDKPADYIALYYRGLYLSRQLKYTEAIKDYLKIIEIGKRNSGIYNNLGFWYIKVNDLRKAENNLSVALQFNATHPYALDNFGHLKYLKGNYKMALELINKSLEIDPSNSYGYKNRALVYIRNNQKELALEDLKKASSLGYGEEYDNEVDLLLKNEFDIG